MKQVILCAFALAAIFASSSTLTAQEEKEKTDSPLATAIKNLAAAPEDEQKALRAKVKKLLEKQLKEHIDAEKLRVSKVAKLLAKMKEDLDSKISSRDADVAKRLEMIWNHAVVEKSDSEVLDKLSRTKLGDIDEELLAVLMLNSKMKLVSVNLPGMT